MRLLIHSRRCSFGIGALASIAALTLIISALPGSSGISGPEPAGARTLYLIRHGEYDHEDQRDPEIGKGLVPLGIAQARLVAARLLSLPVEMTSLHSSTMTRARETAQVIGADFPHLELRQSRLLRECTPATRREDIMKELAPGEAEECEERLDRAFAEFFAPSMGGEQHEIIVCHGNVIRYFVTRVLEVDTESWLTMAIGNCSLTAVRINADGARKLLTFADVGHIPPNMQTGLYYRERNLKIPE